MILIDGQMFAGFGEAAGPNEHDGSRVFGIGNGNSPDIAVSKDNCVPLIHELAHGLREEIAKQPRYSRNQELRSALNDLCDAVDALVVAKKKLAPL